MARQSKSKFGHRHGALRIADVDQRDVARPVESGRAKRSAQDRAAHIHFEFEGEAVARSNRSVLMPAPVRMRTTPAAWPWRIRNAAAQRVPLPEISGALPSEL
jgi:hypothetical protein